MDIEIFVENLATTFEFRGFNKVREIFSDNSKINHYFNQNDNLKGKGHKNQRITAKYTEIQLLDFIESKGCEQAITMDEWNY